MVSTLSRRDLAHVMQGYRLYARIEGKSDKTIAIVTNSVRYLGDFILFEGLPTDITQIGRTEIRAFILYLQRKRCFSRHPFNNVRERGLSGHTHKLLPEIDTELPVMA